MSRKRNLVEAVGYVRTSSAANIGRDKDSERRQRLAIERFAKDTGNAVVDWFNDPAVSGADPIETRPGFGPHILQLRQMFAAYLARKIYPYHFLSCTLPLSPLMTMVEHSFRSVF